MDSIEFTKTITAAFTGHRSITANQATGLRTALRSIIKKWYHEGITNYLCGMALGFDMLAAEVVLSLKEELPDITLTAVVPFRGQADRWNTQNRQIYERILSRTDLIICMSDEFFKGCEMRRNEYMVTNASRLIAYFNGKPHGGTYFTLHLAEMMHLPTINLFNTLPCGTEAQ